MSNPKIGLALGGGAALGWTHIGIIHAMRERGFDIHCVSGTSIGAIVGGCLAADKLTELEEIARSLTWTRMLGLADIQIAKNGVLGGAKVVRELEAHLAGLKIEHLQLPFAAVAVDLIKGERVVLNKGDLVQAIRASISLPGIFSPVDKDDQLLVDGGLMDAVPVEECRNLGADVVIGVNVVGDYLGRADAAGLLRREVPQVTADEEAIEVARVKSLAEKLATWRDNARGAIRREITDPGFLGVGTASFALVMRELARGQLERHPPDLLIEPKVGHILAFEFHRAEELIEIGRESAKDALKVMETWKTKTPS